MQKLKRFCLVVLGLMFFTFQIQAMYALRDGSQREKIEKYALCEKLFKEFVKSDKCEWIFKEIIFDKEKCCKILFNGNKSCYNTWLNVHIQFGNISEENKVGMKRLKKEITTLGDMLEGISYKEVALFKQKKELAEVLGNRIRYFFYEDHSKGITWDSPTNLNYEFPCGTQEKICINGFIECLSMLLSHNFYFETFQKDFALRCRIFVIIFVTFLLSYAGDEIPAMAKTNNVFMKY